MSKFVDKVKKNGIEYEIHDTEGRVKIDGTSLVIPEPASQPLPEPIITIDGVDYYHKCEFDLTKFTLEDSGKFDLLTGLAYIEEPSSSYMGITTYGPDYPAGSRLLYLYLNDSFDFVVYVIANGTSVPASVNYTSRAFTCVNTKLEVTDDTTICLPTCSAYYGWLSEDGKTFISYFNLKDGGFVPAYIDSIEQGNAIISMKDDRLPDAPISEAGKVLKVADAGGYELGESGTGGGTQLYKHLITGLRFADVQVNASVDLITNFSTPATSVTTSSGPGRLIFGDGIAIEVPLTINAKVTPPYHIDPQGFFNNGEIKNGLVLTLVSFADNSQTLLTGVSEDGSFSDTVTAL